MRPSITVPPPPLAVDLANGDGSAAASVYLMYLAAQLAQNDGALNFTLLANAAAICGAACGHPPEKMINQFAACLPIGRDLWRDMTAEHAADVGEVE